MAAVVRNLKTLANELAYWYSASWVTVLKNNKTCLFVILTRLTRLKIFNWMKRFASLPQTLLSLVQLTSQALPQRWRIEALVAFWGSGGGSGEVGDPVIIFTIECHVKHISKMKKSSAKYPKIHVNSDPKETLANLELSKVIYVCSKFPSLPSLGGCASFTIPSVTELFIIKVHVHCSLS